MYLLMNRLIEESNEDIGAFDPFAPRIHMCLYTHTVHVLPGHITQVHEATLMYAQVPKLLLIFLHEKLTTILLIDSTTNSLELHITWLKTGNTNDTK